MSEAPSNHPTADELRALSLGQLAEAELARVSCPPRRLSRVLPPHRSTGRRRSSAGAAPAKRRPPGRGAGQPGPAPLGGSRVAPGASGPGGRAKRRSGNRAGDSPGPQAGRGLRHPGRGRSRRHGGGVQGAAPGPPPAGGPEDGAGGRVRFPRPGAAVPAGGGAGGAGAAPQHRAGLRDRQLPGPALPGHGVGRGRQPGEPTGRQTLASGRGGLAPRDARPCHPRGPRRRGRPPRPEAGQHPLADRAKAGGRRIKESRAGPDSPPILHPASCRRSPTSDSPGRSRAA